ncbi:MAG: DNA topoisomerase III [Burkholderiales bacterium]|nr:DNA topoisomerase III [Burkholderiales bacterium]
MATARRAAAPRTASARSSANAPSADPGGKTLVIAEKPSVAQDIARALGGFTRQDGWFESDSHVVSSAVGHLLEIFAPEDPKRGKWSFTHLPVIPEQFGLQPIEKSQDRLKLLTKLIRRKDIVRIVNACDAGREGELIFRYLVQAAGAKQPIQRLWLQSMTPGAIRDGFERLRDDADLQPLADAARSRSEADWIVGINGTRAMTAFNSKGGGFFLTTVGRVQTPTLAIVVDREKRIKAFVPRTYFEVKARFSAAAGSYEGRWFDPAFRRDETDAETRDTRLWDGARADAVAAACRGRHGDVTEEAKPSTQAPPLLFDLTSLQREANGRFGFSARTTLSLAQELYEKHKVLTYPRTDSKHLPEDYLGTVNATLEALAGQTAYAPFARNVAKQGWVRPNKRIFDNTKISDHFAIIPTAEAPKALGELQQKLYDLVVRRFLAAFHPAAEYRITTRITTVAEHRFRTEGKVLEQPGWLAVYGKESAGDDAELVAVRPGERPLADPVDAVTLVTRPPARFNEATLLSAMEGAGKLVEDDELREAMAQRGLGTPATRAAIIEGLLNEKYMVRDGRDLVPTAKAFQLMTLLHGLGVSELTQPELTGEWEYKLGQIERGGLTRDAFMREIAEMTRTIVRRAKEYEDDTIPGDYATLATPCPHCGGVVKENYRRFSCSQCTFSMTKAPGGRQFELDEVEQLLAAREIGPLQGFRSKMGRPFAAVLRIVADAENDNLKLEFDFGQDNAEDAPPEEIDFGDRTPLGTCPICQGRVFEHGMNYLCENTPKRTCTFKSGKVILQQEIAPAQMTKLLADGRTDLLAGFVSNRNGRKFKAFLVRQPDGKVGFEFAPREPRPSRAGATAANDAQASDAAAAPLKTAARRVPPRSPSTTKKKTPPRKP